MSLINQMLQDLDSRRATAVTGQTSGLPSAVRALPIVHTSQWPWLFAGGLVVALLLGSAFWYLRTPSEKSAAAAPPPAATSIDTARSAQQASPSLSPPALPAAENPVLSPTPLPSSLPNIPPERRTSTQQMRAERDTGLSLTTALHLPRETQSSKDHTAAAPANGQVLIEKSAASGGANERSEGANNAYRKALTALNTGHSQQAAEQLNAALKIDATHSAARQLLFKLLIDERRIDEAIELLQRGLQILPMQTAWAMSLGRLQVERGELSAALQTLQRSLPAALNNSDYQGFIGHVLQRLGRNKEAIESYQAATRLAPSEGRWWLGLGLALESEGRLAEAKEAFLRAESSPVLSPELANLLTQKLRQAP
ncbi:MAG: tetratricopeptide repeat protein [Pseudomonadota bacterium]